MCRLGNQHMTMRQGLTSIGRLVRELISGPIPAARTFNRRQSSVVTGHNTLRRHPYIKGLIGSPLDMRRRAEKENSAHVFCEFEALATLRLTYLGFFFLEPEDVRSRILSMRVIWNFN
jgi:hypothetical protein